MAYFDNTIDEIGFFEEPADAILIPDDFINYRKVVKLNYMDEVGSISFTQEAAHYYCEVAAAIDLVNDDGYVYNVAGHDLNKISNESDCSIEGDDIDSVNSYQNDKAQRIFEHFGRHYFATFTEFTTDHAFSSDETLDIQDVYRNTINDLQPTDDDILLDTATLLQNIKDTFNNNRTQLLIDNEVAIDSIMAFTRKELYYFLEDNVSEELKAQLLHDYNSMVTAKENVYGSEDPIIVAAKSYNEYVGIAIIAKNKNEDGTDDTYHTHNAIWGVYNNNTKEFDYVVGLYNDYSAPNDPAKEPYYNMGIAEMIGTFIWAKNHCQPYLMWKSFEMQGTNLKNDDYSSWPVRFEVEGDITNTTINIVPPKCIKFWFGMYKNKIHFTKDC